MLPGSRSLLVLALFLVPVGAAAPDTTPATPPLVLADPEVLVLPPGMTVYSDDGIAGTALVAYGTSVAGHGAPGQDIILDAPVIVLNGARFMLGSGGPGGQATAHGDGLGGHAYAIGGDGGPGGRLIMKGTVVGPFTVQGGHGGPGGDALAYGRDANQHAPGRADGACTGTAGRADTVQGANGGTGQPGSDAEARGQAGACGPYGGRGGQGGNATATAGNGGAAGGSTGNGGNGGNAYAYAGRGGDGRAACFEDYDAAVASGITQAGHGGDGGAAIARGGNGGTGVIGGAGGTAYGESFGGRGGNATRPPIEYGNGGGIVAGPEVAGGAGGAGVVGGGAGGGAATNSEGGDGGDLCPGQEIHGTGTPGPSSAMVAIAAIGLAYLVRRRTPHA